MNAQQGAPHGLPTALARCTKLVRPSVILLRPQLENPAKGGGGLNPIYGELRTIYSKLRTIYD